MSFVEVKGTAHEVADDVRFAVELMKRVYGAEQGFATNHQVGPRVVYDFARHGGAQVLIPFNKRDFSLYLRDRTRDGRNLSSLLHADQIVRTYPDDGKAIGSLMRGDAPYLRPSASNRVLRVVSSATSFAECWTTTSGSEPLRGKQKFVKCLHSTTLWNKLRARRSQSRAGP